MRQSRTHSGLGLQVNVLKTFEVVLLWLGSGRVRQVASLLPILQDAGLYCGPRLRKGEVFAYVGRDQNLKDL